MDIGGKKGISQKYFRFQIHCCLNDVVVDIAFGASTITAVGVEASPFVCMAVFITSSYEGGAKK